MCNFILVLLTGNNNNNNNNNNNDKWNSVEPLIEEGIQTVG